MTKRKKKSIPMSENHEELSAAQLAAFQPLLSAEEFSELKHEILQSLPPALRINPLKTMPEFARQLVERYGWELTAIPFCAEGYRVNIGQGPAVSATLEHKTGQYYIQEAASMLPVALFENHASDELLTLDLAASPGGKTTHLIARQNDKGLVLANDSSQGRIQALKVVLQHWGATNTAVTRFPGEKYGAWFANQFDRVLIDAPCSMQGLRTAESHEVRPVTEKESRLLSQRQIALLTSALQAAKIGGEVVYSTCTLLPLEDEGVVEVVMNKFKSCVELLDAQRGLPAAAPGIQNSYQADMKRVVRLWPHRYQTAGFFACHLRKVGEFPLRTIDAPEHSMEAAGFFELSSTEAARFVRDFEDWSGYPLQKYLDEARRVLVKRDQRVFLFPELLLKRFRNLPVQSAGILLGEYEGDDFVPSNEWVLRFGNQCEAILAKLDEDQFDVFCGGEDLPDYTDALATRASMRIILGSDGRIAGRGRLQSGRLKNLSSKQLM